VSTSELPPLSLIFVGNSMFYFNDVPRFMEALSGHLITQNSCLHGGGSISSVIKRANGMHPQFRTTNSIVTTFKNYTIYDFGACTVRQALTGNSSLDPSKWDLDMDPHNQNPCIAEPVYMEYLAKYYHSYTPKIDFLLINDNTRNPSRNQTRQESLAVLESVYAPMLLQTGATPIFMWTHAYSVESNDRVNMTGLEDVANFTSLTGVGYRAYADLLHSLLPRHQKPRIAPVGLAFLTIYEENRDYWYTLFHNADHLHASPKGTFLTACVLYYTLYGRMPDKDIALRKNMASLWRHARMMQHAWEPPNPMLSEEDATYLYGIAERVVRKGHVPSSYIDYQNGEVAYGVE